MRGIDEFFGDVEVVRFEKFKAGLVVKNIRSILSDTRVVIFFPETICGCWELG